MLYRCLQSPDATTLTTPDDPAEWLLESKNKWPKWISFTMDRWKGIVEAKLRRHRVRVDYNPLSSFFCPLRAYIDFCAVSGHGGVIQAEQNKPVISERRFVPLFPAFSRAGGFTHYLAPTVSFLGNYVSLVLHAAFSEMAPRPPTPHSLRVVALIWALRCHCSEWKSKKCGRWFGENLKSWEKYARSGEKYVEEYFRKGLLDPIFKFWRFTDCFVCEL